MPLAQQNCLLQRAKRGIGRTMTDTLSLAEARRIALAAQGSGDARPRGAPHLRHLHRVLERTALFQIDSVNVLTRMHYLPLFSRLGDYPRALLEDAAWGRASRRTLFEYWAHEASLLPLELQPLLRWRMARAERGEGDLGRHQALRRRAPPGGRGPPGRASRRRGRSPPPTSTAQRVKGGWWGWSDAKSALEWLFWTGRITTSHPPRQLRAGL